MAGAHSVTPLLLREAHGARDSPVRGIAPLSFDEDLAIRLPRAVAGDTAPLFQLLASNGGLPGVRVNARMVDAFARACASRGAAAERLVATMAGLDAQQAPGASDREILPICAVAALGARAAADASTTEYALTVLHGLADDLRFRVREAVPTALARIGGSPGAVLVGQLDGWMDGLFSATAVVLALASPQWLDTLKDFDGALMRLDEAWRLATDAPRSAARYPGFKALLEALSSSPGVFAARFRTPVFDMMVRWAATCEPPMRDVLEANLGGSKMSGRLKVEAERVHRALKASAPIPRDPTEKVQFTRGRGLRRH